MKVLALSSSRVGDSGFLEKALPSVEEFLGQSTLKIAFIPFASVERSYNDFGILVDDALKHLGHRIDVVKEESGKDLISQSDAIVIGGGNTFKLLHDIYRNGLFELIKQKIKDGTPYIGWSAGANLTGRTICTTNDMPIIQPESFDAFGFLPFQINPHYINFIAEGFHGETRDMRLAEFLHLHPERKIVGLPEGSQLRLAHGQLIYSGSREGVIFSVTDGRIMKHSIATQEDLSHLLA